MFATWADPSVARLVNNATVLGAAQGFAPSWPAGDHHRGHGGDRGDSEPVDNPQLAEGLSVYPHAVTLVPVTGYKQILATLGDASQAGVGAPDVTAAGSGILYFAGDSSVQREP